MHYPGYITRLDKVWGNLSIINHSSAKAESDNTPVSTNSPPFPFFYIPLKLKEREHQNKTKQ